MTIRDDTLIHRLPFIVEEEAEMVAVGMVGYFIEEKCEQTFSSFAKARIIPHTEKIGIWLDYMEMRVHGLGGVKVFVTKTQICNRFPIPGERFYISSV